MTKVYVVEGYTGEYSDRRNWLVKAFLSEEKAQQLVTMLEEWCRVNKCSMNGEAFVNFGSAPRVCPLDPNFQTDYTGTRYYCYGVELDDADDQP